MVTFFLTLLLLSRHVNTFFIIRIANQIGMLLPRVTMIIVLTVLTFNVDKEKRVEKEDRERINHALGDGEAEEQGNLHHFPKKSESFEAFSGPACWR